jgi:hypothetical protein
MTVHSKFNPVDGTVMPTRELDLVFCMDVTGSMGSYINAAKCNIKKIIKKLVETEGYIVRFGLVVYRDHPPQDMSFVSKTFKFTSDPTEMEANLATLAAQGGGDGPEAVEAGLLDTLQMDWRDDAAKICILIADAPPHGLGEAGDGFSNGAPTGVDPLVVLDAMSKRGITIYSVGCQPALSAYAFATDFFIAVAERTNGQAVALGSAAVLADVILGGAIETMDLQSLRTVFDKRMYEIKAEHPTLDENEIKEQVYRAFVGDGTRTRQLQVPRLASENSGLVSRADSLELAKAALSAMALEEKHGIKREAEKPTYRGLSAAADVADEETHYNALGAAGRAGPSSVYRSATGAETADDVDIKEDPISREQIDRLFMLSKAAKTTTTE